MFASAPFCKELADVLGVPILDRDEDVVAVVVAGGGIGDPGLVSGKKDRPGGVTYRISESSCKQSKAVPEAKLEVRDLVSSDL